MSKNRIMKRAKTGGRQKGSKNKKTMDERIIELRKQDIVDKSLKDIVIPYAHLAINALFESLKSDNPTVKVTAANSLLDRGYGKAPQYIEKRSQVLIADVTPIEMSRRMAYIMETGVLASDQLTLEHNQSDSGTVEGHDATNKD